MSDTVNVDDILQFQESIENGTYDVRLLDIEAFTSKSGTDMVKMLVEVVGGDAEDLEYTWFYNLTGYPIKKGKRTGQLTYPGLANLKRDLANLGLLDKMPKQWPLDPTEMKLTLHKVFKGSKFKLIKKNGKAKEDGGFFTETILVPHLTHAHLLAEEEDEIPF